MIPIVGYLVLLILIAWLGFLLRRTRAKLARYQSIDDDTRGPVIQVELDDYRHVACNPSFAALLGYSSPSECVELFGQYPHLRGYTFRQLYHLIRKQSRTTAPMSVVDRQGKLVAAEVKIMLVHGGDIMELRPAARLEEAPAVPTDIPQLLKQLFFCFVWELDRDTGRIEHDPSWLVFLGYESLPDTGHLSFWEEIVYPEDQESLRRELRRLFDGEMEKLNIRYRLASSSGEEHWIETSAIVKTFDIKGKPRRIQGIHRVVADEIDNQNAEAITDKHDMANQLASILGYAGLLSQSDLLPDNLDPWVREIEQAGEQARKLLQGSRETTYKNNHVSNPKGTYYADAEEEMIDSLEACARRYNMSVIHHHSIPGGRIESSSLSKILDPICANAREATGDESEISLETGSNGIPDRTTCSSCGAPLRNSYHWIRIHDKGEGISPDHLAWIFAPGFSTRSVSPERGQGLSQADALVHKLGGHIHIRSTVGKGTQVTIYLPEATPRMVRERPAGRGHVLIVDDERSVVGYLQELMRQHGYRVTTSTDPRQALTTFRDDPATFDLVITDQTMSGISGDALTRTMLESRPDLPIIICTGYSGTTGTSTAGDTGARGYIAKPVDTERLLTLISESLHGESTPG